LPPSTVAVALQGPRLWLGGSNGPDGSSWSVLSLADPDRPEVVLRMPVPNVVQDLVVTEAAVWLSVRNVGWMRSVPPSPPLVSGAQARATRGGVLELDVRWWRLLPDTPPELGCVVGPGASCEVLDVDAQSGTARVRWTLPRSVGVATLGVHTGDHDLYAAGWAHVETVP
jgi:hypothetical protein